MPRVLLTLLFAALVAVLTWALLLAKIDTTLLRDWDYFNALANFVRSSVHTYGVLPLHDPWRCGGLDVLANPQSRWLYPLALGDFFLPPHQANIVFIVVHTALGAFITFVWFRALKFSIATSALCTWMFVHCTWFAMHLGEGHMPFAMFTMLPALPLCLMRIERRIYRWLALTLPAFWLLGGGHYIVIFGAYFALACMATGAFGSGIIRTYEAFRRDLAFTVASLVPLLLVSFVRFAPIAGAAILETRKHEYIGAWRFWREILFEPFQARDFEVPGYGFHEFACYLGVMTLTMAVVALTAPGMLRRLKGVWLGVLLWWWVGFGLFRDFNPWGIHSVIPVLNTAHVQPRLLLFAQLLMLVLMAHGLRRLPRFLAVAVGLFLFAESTYTQTYTLGTYYRTASMRGDARFITSERYGATKKTAYYARDYFDDDGAAYCYEPAWARNERNGAPPFVHYVGQDGYQGEATFVTGQGRAEVVSHTPAELRITYETSEKGDLEINTNSLGGFEIVEGPAGARVASHHPDLLRIDNVSGTGVMRLRYAPWYVWPVIGSAVAALLLMLVTFGFCVRFGDTQRV